MAAVERAASQRHPAQFRQFRSAKRLFYAGRRARCLAFQAVSVNVLASPALSIAIPRC